MYDPKNEPREFFGASRGEAVAKACEHFGVGEEALTIREFAAGEVYGAAGRAVLVAVPRDAVRPEPRSSRGPDRGDRNDRGDRGPRRERGGGGRDRGGRGDRDRGRRGGGGPRRQRSERDWRDEPAPAEAHDAAPTGPSEGRVSGSLGPIGEFVLGALERMELGPFEISESGEDEFIVVQVRGEAAERVAASEFRAGEALQLLANQAAMRNEDGDQKRVVVDIEGDEDAREDFLTRLAERVANRARETGRSTALEPMNARDRRIVHVALRDVEGIATMSQGEGRYRQVVVVPEGAPQYEEAARSSREAARDSD